MGNRGVGVRGCRRLDFQCGLVVTRFRGWATSRVADGAFLLVVACAGKDLAMNRFLLAGGAVLTLILGGLAIAADQWPQFRGPQGKGLTEQKLATEWGAEKNIAWKVTVPGTGWSQPVVWGDKIYVTTAITENQQKPRPGGGGSTRPD